LLGLRFGEDACHVIKPEPWFFAPSLFSFDQAVRAACRHATAKQDRGHAGSTIGGQRPAVRRSRTSTPSSSLSSDARPPLPVPWHLISIRVPRLAEAAAWSLAGCLTPSIDAKSCPLERRRAPFLGHPKPLARNRRHRQHRYPRVHAQKWRLMQSIVFIPTETPVSISEISSTTQKIPASPPYGPLIPDTTRHASRRKKVGYWTTCTDRSSAPTSSADGSTNKTDCCGSRETPARAKQCYYAASSTS